MNVWCAIRTFPNHAKELGNVIPKEPAFFLKASSCVVPPMVLDTFEGDVHHEIELVIRLDDELMPSEMTVGLDLTKRSAQNYLKEQGMPWTEAKSFYCSAMIGPWVPYHPKAEITLIVNENKVQNASIESMLWTPEQLVKKLSSWAPIMPGDLLFKGTPSGVGPLQPGDVIRASLHVYDEEMSHFVADCV